MNIIACVPTPGMSYEYHCLCPHSRWLRELFEEADRNGDGTLDLREVVVILRRLNVGVSKKVIRQKFKVRLTALDVT